MRTDGFGVRRRSSTSGVLPTSETRLSATSGLCTAFPNDDRRLQLPEQLVDPPEGAAERGVDRVGAVRRRKLVAAAAQTRDPQEVGRDVPLALLEHPLAPLRVDGVDRAEAQPGRPR